MALNKVYGGTLVGNESRCVTCTYSRLIKGYKESEMITFCDRLYDPIVIPFIVAECSDYSDKRIPSIESLEKIALMVDIKRAGAGFVASEREELVNDD